VEKSFSCIAGKFLLYRNHGGEISVVQLNALFLEQSIETRWRESGYTACFGDIVACEGYEIKEVLLLDIGIG